MSDRSSVYAAVLAVSVAFAGFSVLSVWAPVGYPLDTVWDDELIREVVFEGGDFRALEIIQARLVYRNPSDRAVSFNLTYPVSYTRYVDGVRDSHGGSGAEGDWEMVTVPARGEYTVCHAGFQPEASGWYEVEWDGVRWGIAVAGSEAAARIVTDKPYYRVGEGGTATYEFYNPTAHNITIGPPGRIEAYIVLPDGREGDRRIMYGDWAWGNYTLRPGDSFRVYSFHFTTYQVGRMTIVVNDARKVVQVLAGAVVDHAVRQLPLL
jgi:hypothetical protein